MSDSTQLTHRYVKQAILVPASSIIVGKDRVRTDFSGVEELAASILAEGLLHPPVISQDNQLIAGECRLRAMRDVLKWQEIPVNYFEVLDAAHLARLENDENVTRRNVSWKDRVMSIAKQHSLMELQNALISERWGQAETGKLLGMSQANVNYALKVARLIKAGDKDVIAAESMADAFRIIIKRAEDDRNRALVALTSSPAAILNAPLGGPGPANQPAPGGAPTSTPTVASVKEKTAEELDAELFGEPLPKQPQGVFTPAVAPALADLDELPDQAPTPTTAITVSLSSMFTHLDGARDLIRRGYESVDHIICDLPYGIDMDNILQANGGQDITATREGHDIEENIDFMQRIIPAAFDALRNGGFFIAFYDLEYHNMLFDLGRKSGFKVQNWPLVWAKTHRCSNKSAGFNFTKSHEVAFVFRKGDATLLQSQDRSVWTGSNEVEAKALGHPFAKPFKLWEWLYSAVAQRGQLVYDPCVGRGSSTIAALNLGLRPAGAEKIEADYNALIVNVQNWYRTKDSTVQFK